MLHPRFYQSDAIDSVHPLRGRKLIVIPTGGGKSLVIGRIAVDNTPLTGRVLVLVDVKELVEQNARAILNLDPLADLGVVCAGLDPDQVSPVILDCLGRTDAEITVASIQSVYKKLDLWHDIGLIIIDEAHRITPIGGKLYRAVLDAFPDVPVVGLTATPFRMGTGFLHEGEHRLFDEISFEITHHELVDKGYLVPFASRGSELAYQDDGLRKVAGEFSQTDLAELVKDGAKTHRIVKQFIQRARERNHWLIFAINVRHARMIKEFLAAEGKEAGIIYHGMEKEGLNRDDEIDLFKMGVYQALINVNVLTTGFDFPALDCVILCRPIASIVLYIQCLGRGTRLSADTGKKDCLVLDYGGNVSRHGDFSKPDIRQPGKGKKTKACEPCGELNTAGARYCAACGGKFKNMFKDCPKCKHEVDRSAHQCPACNYYWPVNEINLDEDGKTIIQNKPVWLDIADWKAKRHEPREKERPNCVKVIYRAVDGATFPEYIFPESFAARPKFEKFWSSHGGNTPAPGPAIAVVARFRELKMPKAVKVIRQGPYFNILAREH